MKTLADLQPGQRAIVREVALPRGLSDRLSELGILPGALVELRHEGPLGGDPIAIHVRGTVLALRRRDARTVLVEGVSA